MKRIMGGALVGCGYALMQAAPNVYNEFLIFLMSGAGIIMLIVGIRMLWIAWKTSRNEG